MTPSQERLVQQLLDRLQYHLNQVCDERACETPEHEETRALIDRAKAALKNVVLMDIHLDPLPRTGPFYPRDFRRRA